MGSSCTHRDIIQGRRTVMGEGVVWDESGWVNSCMCKLGMIVTIYEVSVSLRLPFFRVYCISIEDSGDPETVYNLLYSTCSKFMLVD